LIGISLILQAIFEFDPFLIILFTLPVMLFYPTKNKDRNWSMRKKIVIFSMTLIAMSIIVLLSIYISGENINKSPKIILLTTGIGLFILGIIMIFYRRSFGKIE
jgi:cytochrome c biogenesis protein CcdA